jgi:predicted RNA binding protein YcfA (HicA-like mRNA interferase family)
MNLSELKRLSAQFESYVGSLVEQGLISREFGAESERNYEELFLDLEELLKPDISEDRLRELEAWLDWPEEDPGAWTRGGNGKLETLAWYQPITFHGPDAGIFITLRGLRIYGSRILRGLNTMPSPPRDAGRIAFLGAIGQLLAHEVFHHQVEWMSMRFDFTFGRPQWNPLVSRYEEYFRKVYEHDFNHPGALEEALASASESVEFPKAVHRFKFDSAIKKRIRSSIESSYATRPPGYKDAMKYLNPMDYAAGIGDLLAKVYSPSAHWLAGGFGPLMGVQRSELSKYFFESWRLVADAPQSAPNPPPFSLSVPDRGLKRLLEREGYLPSDQGKGSHEVWKKPQAPIITLPKRKDQQGYQILKSVAVNLGFKDIRQLAEASRNA